MSQYTFDQSTSTSGDTTAAWALMTDVPRLVRWISVLGEAHEEEQLSRYTAVIADRVGMFSLRADLDISVVELDEPEMITIRAEGQDRQIGSRITIEATVEISTREDGTQIRVHGSYGITGRAATLGASQIKRKGEKVIAEFFDNLTRELQNN